MRDPGKTPPFRGSDGEVLPGSIAEVAYLRLGGVDQWTMIRGERLANPALILLHGGPGLSETRSARSKPTVRKRKPAGVAPADRVLAVRLA